MSNVEYKSKMVKCAYCGQSFSSRELEEASGEFLDYCSPECESDHLEEMENDGPECNSPDEPVLGAEFDSLAAGQKIIQDTLVFEVHIGAPGFYRTINTKKFVKDASGVDVEDSDVGVDESTEIEDDKPKKLSLKRHVSVQEIIDKKYYAPLVAQKNEFKSYLKKLAIESPFLKAGLLLIPVRFGARIEDKLEEFQRERQQLISEFMEKYPEAIEDAKKQLGTAFESSRYESEETLKSKYYVEARWWTLDVPKALSKISKEALKKAQERHRVEMADAAQAVRDALRIEFTKLVESFAERLGTDEATGKPKKFQHTRLDNLKEFIELFNDKNLTNDDELAELSKKALALVDGVEAADIKSDLSFREALESGFNKIKDEASKMVVVKGRKYKFDDDDSNPGSE